MSRRRVRRLLIPLAGLILLLAGATIFRKELAAEAVHWQLARAGLAADFTITTLGHERTAITNLAIAGITVRRLELDYTVGDLLRGEVRKVLLDGLRMSIDLTGASPPLGPFQPFLEGRNGDAESIATQGPPRIPDISLRDAELRLSLPSETVSLELEGDLVKRESQAAEIDLAYSASGAGLQGDGRASFLLEALIPVQGTLSFDGGDTDEQLSVSLRAGSDLSDRQEIAFHLTLSAGGEIESLARLLPADIRLPLSQGRFAFSATADTRLAEVPTFPAVLASLLSETDGSVSADLQLDDALVPGRAQDVSARLALSLDLRDRLLTLSMPRRGTLRAGRIDPAWLVADLGLPAEIEPLLSQGLAADGSVRATGMLGTDRVPEISDLQAELTLHPDVGGTVDMTLTQSADAPLHIALGVDDLVLPGHAERLSGSARLSTATGEDGREVRLDEPIALQLRGLTPAGPDHPLPVLADVFRERLDVTVSDRQDIPFLVYRPGAGVTLALDAAVSAVEEGPLILLSLPRTELRLNTSNRLEYFDISTLSLRITTLQTDFGLVQDLRLDGDLNGTLEAFTAELAFSLALDELQAADVSGRSVRTRGRLHLSGSGEQLTATLPELDAGAQALALPGGVSLVGPQFVSRDTQVDLQRDEEGWRIEQIALLLEPAALGLTIVSGEPAARTVELRLGSVAARLAGRLTGPLDLSLQAPIEALISDDPALELRDAVLQVVGDPLGEVEFQLSGGRLQDNEPHPRFAPLIPTLTTVRRAERVSFQGHVTAAAAPDLTLALEGYHDLAANDGRVVLALPATTLGPGGIVPGDLLPQLEAFTFGGGSVEFDAVLTWAATAMQGNGRLQLRNVHVQRDDLSLSGLHLDLVLERLFPPATPPGQPLEIASLTAGIDARDLRAGLRIVTGPQGQPELLVESLAMTVAGGRLHGSDGRYDPSEGTMRLTVEAESLDLETLLAPLQLEELRGTGRLSGPLPLRIEGGYLIVEGASLEAEGPGVVAFRSPEARAALAGGGEAVELMLDALEDFHYDVLRLSLDKPAVGEANITLRLQGHNPAVLDGYPFDLNISLTGDAVPLLDAMAEGRRLSQDVLRQLWDLAR